MKPANHSRTTQSLRTPRLQFLDGKLVAHLLAIDLHLLRLCNHQTRLDCLDLHCDLLPLNRTLLDAFFQIQNRQRWLLGGLVLLQADVSLQSIICTSETKLKPWRQARSSPDQGRSRCRQRCRSSRLLVLC